MKEGERNFGDIFPPFKNLPIIEENVGNKQSSSSSTTNTVSKIIEIAGPIIGEIIKSKFMKPYNRKLKLTGEFKGDKIDVELSNNKFVIIAVIGMLSEIFENIQSIEKSDKAIYEKSLERQQELTTLKDDMVEFEHKKKEITDKFITK